MEIIEGKHLQLNFNGKIIALDHSNKSADYCFMSHAHSDHIIKTKNKVICSDKTLALSKIKGCNLNQSEFLKDVELINSGHIFGSKALLAKDEQTTLFTGDFSLQNRGFMNGFKPVKCDNLIIEATFSNPLFMFPNFKDEMKRAEDFVNDNMKKGYLSVLMSYALGKNQELQYYFKNYKKAIHNSIKPFNQVYEDFGVSLGEDSSIDCADVLFSTPMRPSNNFFNEIKRKKGVKFAVFSGWNVLPSYKNRFLADEGFTVSDHADFKELLKTIHECKAKNVYIIHGGSKEFADLLKREGYNVKLIS